MWFAEPMPNMAAQKTQIYGILFDARNMIKMICATQALKRFKFNGNFVRSFRSFDGSVVCSGQFQWS